jgi:ParB-like chromosome segregation protein Spo0J
VVCEDGDEYTTRFARLLGQEIAFERAGTHAEAARLLRDGGLGILLDLDFRRTSAADLVDEEGATHDLLADGERRRLADMQGILILRALRGAGISAPAILFADLDEPSRGDYLECTLAPLSILPSSASLLSIAQHIRALTART